MLNRRHFLQSTLLAALGCSTSAADRRVSRILLRSSWQTINIGDVGHTPGVLALMETHLPEAEVYLWPTDVSQGVKEMLLARFPKLVVLDTQEKIVQAISSCDFLLHGSGPYLVAPDAIEKWTQASRKPYGVYGITLPPERAGEREVALLSGARFVYFRDSVSLLVARDKGVKAPVMEFCPDAAFAVDLREDGKAMAFLAKHNLTDGQFLCCIPRYRITPDWMIPRKHKQPNPEKQALNDQWREHDHAPLREEIVQVVRETSMKVLICPEDETQISLGKEMIFDKLPEGAKARTIWRPNFWLTDEALSVYVRSAGLFGNEMHSPIMSIGNGIPAIVCRWDTQTSKGLMWRDIGLGSWLFDFDHEDEVARMPSAVVTMAKDPVAAKAKAGEAQRFVQQRQRATMEKLRLDLQLESLRG